MVESRKWIKNLIVFFIPVLVLYLGQVAIVLQTSGNVVEVGDFAPSSFTLGTVVLYLTNVLIDYAKKVQAS